MQITNIKPGYRFIDRRMNAELTVASVNEDTDTISVVGYDNHGFLQSADGTYKFTLSLFSRKVEENVYELVGEGEIPTKYFGTSSLN